MHTGYLDLDWTLDNLDINPCPPVTGWRQLCRNIVQRHLLAIITTQGHLQLQFAVSARGHQGWVVTGLGYWARFRNLG